MTNIVTLTHKVLVDLNFTKVHTVLTKHPHWTKQHAPKQTTHTGLADTGATCEVTIGRGNVMQALSTFQRDIHGVND